MNVSDKPNQSPCTRGNSPPQTEPETAVQETESPESKSPESKSLESKSSEPSPAVNLSEIEPEIVQQPQRQIIEILPLPAQVGSMCGGFVNPADFSEFFYSPLVLNLPGKSRDPKLGIPLCK